MIIFLADGRLGNQLFQYAFLKTIKKENEIILVSGFEEIKEVFEIEGVFNVNKKNKWTRALVFRVIKPILLILSNKKIISSLEVMREDVLTGYSREAAGFINKEGFFKNIKFIKLGFFQSETFFDEKEISQLRIKTKFINIAKQKLKQIPEDYTKIFIHIRRGDYKEYKVYGKNTLLPLKYYKEQIEWFENNRKKPFFIFLSDEPEFIEKEFSYIDNKLTSENNHYGVDLAIMTQCSCAILSPSSFGWWGSYLMKRKDTIFAPKYWLGFNSLESYHSNALPNCSIPIEI